jgi:DNA protecting protein DprA
MLKGVGPATLRKVATVPNFHELGVVELKDKVPALARSLSDSSDAWSQARSLAQEQVDEAEKSGARILSSLDPEYPALLASTRDDPFLLFIRGKLLAQPEKSVAVIGTREPTAHGEMIAARITNFFAEQGWSIVSGLAIGCDAIAHRTALDCRGHTVAVLAHGLHMIAPTRHKKLAEEIVESGGALVSEYRFGQDVQKQQYVKRDKTQAGLAQGVVMTQSDLVGGSLHASRAALEYGRWLAVPYPTEKDRQREEPKVQANLLIADGSDKQVIELLRCSDEALKNIVVLKSKEDYALLLNPPVKGNRNPGPHVRERPDSDSFVLAMTAPDDDFGSDVVQETRRSAEESLAGLVARQKYIIAKFREIDALTDCLPAASPETRWELQFELENVLSQMLDFIVEAGVVLQGSEAFRAQLKGSGTALIRELGVLRNAVVHGHGVSHGPDREPLAHVATDRKVQDIRGEFAAFAAPAIELIRSS